MPTRFQVDTVLGKIRNTEGLVKITCKLGNTTFVFPKTSLGSKSLNEGWRDGLNH